MDIYIARGKDRKGPYSEDSVQQFLADGVLDGTELAWHEGLDRWITLSQVIEVIFQETSSTQPPMYAPIPLGQLCAQQKRSFKYKAFISYSHQDKKWGSRLHKALETYRVPKDLVGKTRRHGEVPKRLFPVFRDQEELPTSSEINTLIKQALRDSGHLIVICSPRSAKSRWVNEEVRYFKQLGKADRIQCLIVDGEPNAADKPGLELEECFPEALKYELGADGQLIEKRTEPLAADARKVPNAVILPWRNWGMYGNRDALLKILAGLLGVDFDDLKKRDLERARKRMAVVASMSVAVMVVMGALTVWAMTQKKEAERQKVVAENKQKEVDQQNYFNVIALAQSKIDGLEYDQARVMLWATPKALRSWEWGYLIQLCNQELMILKGHGGGVGSVAFSPDGWRVVTGSSDKTAKIWDAVSGTELLTLKGHGDRVLSVAFSPDGRRVVTGSGDKTAKIWDAINGRELVTLKGHGEHVSCAAFSYNGRFVVTGSWDGTMKIWDGTNGKGLLTLKGYGSSTSSFFHENGVYSVAFSPDGRQILSNNMFGTVKIWDVARGAELLTLKGTSGEAAFSPDGRWIVAGVDKDNIAKIWDAASGAEWLTLKGHGKGVFSVAFSPDGKRVVTGSFDRTVKIWDAASGKELRTFKGHSVVPEVAFSPDGRRVVTTGSEENSAKIWDATNSKELLTLKLHESGVFYVAFSSDGRRVVTAGSSDRTAKIWDAASGTELQTLRGHSGSVGSVAFSPDGRRVVTGSLDDTAKIWDATSGAELQTLKGHPDPVNSAAFSPDGRRVLTGSWDGTAKIWDAKNGQELLTLKGHSRDVLSVAFSPDGRHVVTGSSDKTAKIWDAAGGKELQTLKGHSWGVRSVAFSPDDRHVVTGSSDGTAKIWDAASGVELLTLKGHGSSVCFAAFSPDGKRVVTGSWDDTVKIWDVAGGTEVLTLKGHSGSVRSIALSPNGRRVLAAGASEDGALKIWDAVDWNLTKEEFKEQKLERYQAWLKRNEAEKNPPPPRPRSNAASKSGLVNALASLNPPPHQSLSRRGGRRRVAAMKQILVMIAVVALVGCGKKEAPKQQTEANATVTPNPEPPKAAAEKLITDPIVEKAVREYLDKPTGELTKTDLENVTSLDLEKNQLTDVKGLENLTQLTRLELINNKLTDVKGLEKLTQLTGLVLAANKLTDLKELEKFTQLELLVLRDNPDLTKAQIAKLQKALPKCKIIHNAK